MILIQLRNADKAAVVKSTFISFNSKYRSRRQRVVRQGKIVTAAGVSAGIDMALMLVALEGGEESAKGIQLAIEYDPQPPFDSGSVEKASPATIEKVKFILEKESRRAAGID